MMPGERSRRGEGVLCNEMEGRKEETGSDRCNAAKMGRYTVLKDCTIRRILFVPHPIASYILHYFPVRILLLLPIGV